MPCKCASLPNIFKLGSNPGFEEHIVKVASENWVDLYRCTTCGQLWRIDAWDKYQLQFVIRLPSEQNWALFDVEPLQKEFLLRARGGTVNEPCAWANCQSNRVCNVPYCLNHLYATGARE